MNTNEDWEKYAYGERMKEIGFTDYLYIDFPDDSQIVIDNENKIIGGITQDSGVIVVVYLEELEKHNPNYEEGFYSKENRTIIKNFDGEVSYEIIPIEINGHQDTDTIISGKGNICFKSCYKEDLN